MKWHLYLTGHGTSEFSGENDTELEAEALRLCREKIKGRFYIANAEILGRSTIGVFGGAPQDAQSELLGEITPAGSGGA